MCMEIDVVIDNLCVSLCLKQTPFARDSFLKDEMVDKLNEGLTYVSPS